MTREEAYWILKEYRNDRQYEIKVEKALDVAIETLKAYVEDADTERK